MTPAELEELRVFAERPTRARARAEAQGWTFGPVSVRLMDDGMMKGYIRFDGTFTCVCGRVERLGFLTDEKLLEDPLYRDQELDPALRLRKLSALSRDHLILDGFTEPEISEIERKGREFDERERAEARLVIAGAPARSPIQQITSGR